jgi:hypothetical protein
MGLISVPGNTGWPSLFVVPFTATAICLLSVIGFLRKRVDMFATLEGILGIVGLAAFFAVIRQTGIELAVAVIGTHEYGYWMTILGLAAVILGCFPFPRLQSE